MKKSLIFCAALLACALSFQSCDKVDNPGEPTETVIDNGSDLKDVIAQYAKDGVLNLPAGVELTMNEEIEVTEPLIIVGDEKKPATIIAKAGLVVSKGIILNNIKIDASELNAPLITMPKTPVVDANEKGAYIVDNITLKSVDIIGLKGSLYWDNSMKYGIPAFTIDDCIIQLNTDKSIIKNEAWIACQGGGFKDFAIKNSTVYNISETGAKYFLRYSNNGRLDNLGYDKTKEFQTWTYTNNTFYKTIDNTDNGQWGNGPNGQSYFKYDIQDNIWVDTSKDIIRRLCNGRYNTTYLTFANNTYWRNGGALDESSYDKSGTALATDPAFKDATNGIFTPTGTEQVEKKTGDPRWYNAN